METVWSWGPEGAGPFTDPSQTPEDGMCSLLSLPEPPEGSDLLPPSLALFKVF